MADLARKKNGLGRPEGHWPIDSHRDQRAASLLTYDAWLEGGRTFDLYYCEVDQGQQTQVFTPTHCARDNVLCAARHDESVSGNGIWREIAEGHVLAESRRGQRASRAADAGLCKFHRRKRRFEGAPNVGFPWYPSTVATPTSKPSKVLRIRGMPRRHNRFSTIPWSPISRMNTGFVPGRG